MGQTKATKKFEQRHLKDTLERRNNLKKIKQKQQLKAKKQARRAEENGRTAEATEDDGGKAAARKGASSDALQSMSVDDFFQGGFEIAEQPKQKGAKRKRKETEVADNGSDSEEEESEDDLEEHQKQLDALADTDPEFHRFLQENEPELLGAELAMSENLSDDEDGEQPKRKKQRKGQGESDDETTDSNELSPATIKKWQTALVEQHSLRTAREVVLAFRSAAHASEDDDKQYKYSISSPEVYHQLLTLALKHIPSVFQHHLPIQESKSGKFHVATDSKKFKTIGPILKSHMASVLHLLDHLSDAPTLQLTLSSTLPLLPYLLSFKKILRDLGKAVTTVWSTNSQDEAARIAAFLVLRRLVVIGDPGIRESILKATYQGFVRGSRQTTIHTIGGVNLMKNSASELWGFDASVGYTTAFNYIRQLAIHLRSSIQNKTKESYKQVYNWQYMHSLDFWSRVLSAHCATPESPLRPLIYPLVQVTLGALRLIPTATYFPLRFQLIRSLLRLSRATATYIPLAPALYEVLSSAEMRKAPKPSTLKPMDFATSIRAGKSYLRTRTYQDSVGEQVQELLSEFFALWCKNIAFPELALPVTVMLKRWLKDVNQRGSGKGNKNAKVNSAVTLLLQKIEANVRFVEERRARVEFAPHDRRGVEAFLKDVEWEKTPLGAFVSTQRTVREEKARVLEESRKEEARRDKRNQKDDDVVEEDEDDEDDVSDEDDELVRDGASDDDEGSD